MDISKNSFAIDYVTTSCDFICITDLEMRLHCASDLWKKMFPESISRLLTEVFENDGSDFNPLLDAIRLGNFKQEIIVEKVFQNDTLRSFLLQIHPYFQGAGIGGYYVLAKEIKAVSPVEETLEILNKKFEDVFNYSIIGMAIISISGEWIEVNQQVCDMVGYSKQELKAFSFQEITHPSDLHKDLELLERLLRGEIEFYKIKKRYYHKDGHLVWVNLSVSMVCDREGDPSYFVAQIEDVSITEKAQETIRENENIFKEIFHSSYQFTALLTKEGKIMEINNAALEFLGITAKESIGKPFYKLLNWDSNEKKTSFLFKNIQNAVSGVFINSEETLSDNVGNQVRIDYTLKPVFNEKQEVVSVVAEGKIIQEIIDARFRLLESEQKLRSFFSLSPVGFVVNDLETGQFIELNDSILENTGYTREEFLAFNYWNLFPDEYRWMEPLVIKKLKETGVFGPIEIEYARKDGVRFPIMINGMVTKNSDGKEQIWSVVQDISELKQKEQQLQSLNDEIEAQNVLLSASNDELEQFAYVASHDLQEPLRMITGFLTLLGAKYNSQLDEKAREYIHFAVDGANRLRQVIVDLLEYSKIDRDQTESQWTDLELIIQNVTQLFAGTIHDKKAEISWRRLPRILGRKVPVQQLFSNLISNALKYQLAGNSPRIEISFVELENYWQFCISDNGIGISEEFHDKIFALFSRLNGKREYEGTGIGLALCKKIVEKHGGKIWVESEVDKGSKFYFTLSK